MSAQDTNTVSITTDGANKTIVGTTEPQPQAPEGLRITSTMEFDDAGKPTVNPGVPEPTPDVTPQTPKTEPTVDPVVADISAHQKAATDAVDLLGKNGFDINTLTAEWNKNGGMLTEATVSKLEAAGISRDMQTTFIEGQKARADRVYQSLYDSVGGKENYEAAFAWAAKNLTPGELSYIRDTYVAGNIDAVRMIVTGVHSRMSAANAAAMQAARGAPTLPEGSPRVPQAGIAPFRSAAEQQEAFSDPRYQKSQAYREEVQRRVAATMNMGKRR